MQRRKWLGERQLAQASAAFLAEVTAALEACGAVRDLERAELWGAPCYQLRTKAGLLQISAVLPTADDGGWVAMRFDDVEAAKAVLGAAFDLNPFSGKWNLHMEEQESGYGDLVRRHLARVL